MHRRSCLCGAVQITAESDLPQPNACHRVACRKQTGNFGASFDVPCLRTHVEGEEAVSWYQSSEKVRRGFCSTCGSTLF